MEHTGMMAENFTVTATPADSFMDEVYTYLIFKIAIYISKFWFPILVPLGVVGNVLSFLVMIKPNNRKMSTCIFMAAISVNDNLMMCMALHNWLLSVVKVHNWYAWECRFAAFLTMLAVQNATYQVLAMTADKYIVIKWPHKAAILSTPKRAKITVICIYIFVIVYNIPYLFITKLVGLQCLGYAAGGVITVVYSWLTFTINAIIPFSLLIYMNCVIIQRVRQSQTLFRNDKSSDETQGHYQNNAAQRRQKTMKNTERQLTIMLILVTTLFLVLMIPTNVRFLCFIFINRDTPAKYANLMFLYHLTHKLYHTNNGINFYLYCISGQKFRNDLKEIICSNTVENSAPFNSRDTSQSHVTDISNVGQTIGNL